MKYEYITRDEYVRGANNFKRELHVCGFLDPLSKKYGFKYYGGQHGWHVEAWAAPLIRAYGSPYRDALIKAWEIKHDKTDNENHF